MLESDLSQSKSTWTEDYDRRSPTSTGSKAAHADSMDLIYPDLEWILLTDASDIGVGWMLVQLRPTDDGVVTEVSSVGSAKFSTGAEQRWSINEKDNRDHFLWLDQLCEMYKILFATSPTRGGNIFL